MAVTRPEEKVTLSGFEADLRTLLGKQSGLRPFVCDGSPLKCEIFIVGFNPATDMPGDFWQHWHSESGFDKETWFSAYQEHRKLRARESGKQYRSISNTRRVIDFLLKEVSPIRCLETNIYAVPTAKAMELTRAHQDIAPFMFLLDAIKPRVVVTHGRKAAEAANILGIANSADLMCKSHFSRGWSESNARTLGREIREKWKSRP